MSNPTILYPLLTKTFAIHHSTTKAIAMTTFGSSTKRHHNNQHTPVTSFSILLLFLLVSILTQRVFASTPFIAPTCKAEQLPLAYVNKGNTNNDQPKPLMRAWMCHGNTHKEMVGKLAQAGIVKAPINKQALLAVDRRNYVLNEDYAYDDSPQPIGYSATISAPHMHAHVLEDLLPPLVKASQNQPTKPLSILDVGCGSGYLTTVFGRLVEPKATRKMPSSTSSPVLNEGKVYGIDVIPQLVEMSKTNIQKQDGDLFDSKTIEVMVRDGWKGYPEGSPYNAIHVGAAADTFPTELMKQLAVGGVMVIPVRPEGGMQYLYQVERLSDSGVVVGLDEIDSSKGFHEEDYEVRRVLGVRYVPLVRTGE